MSVNIGIVGATGMVGRSFLKIIDDFNLSVENLYCFASKKSEGTTLEFRKKKIKVIKLDEKSFNREIDILFFCAGGHISRKYVPIAVEKNIVVIDNSSAYRMDKEVPLIVVEVNKEKIKDHKGIISNPNCSTIQGVVPLKILDDKFKIKRVVYSTYQAVSGAGQKGINDLLKGETKVFSKEIKNNCIPEIDVFMDNGYTFEEMKMINETKKILDNDNIRVTATTVRVPVVNCHSESINVEFEKNFKDEEIKEILDRGTGIVLIDDIKNKKYPTVLDANGRDEVFVGRVRRDLSVVSGINMWVVADNIRKGASTNAVQIAKYLIDNNLV